MLKRPTRIVSRPTCSVTVATAVPGAAKPKPSLKEYNELAVKLGAQASVVVDFSPLGRGLIVPAPVTKQSIVSVPVTNALVVTDSPLDGISIFGDRHHRQWQSEHGTMPADLLLFIQGEERWDVRLTAWLLWLSRYCASDVWRSYCQLLPKLDEVTVLLSYSAQEATELQVQELVDEARNQRDWAEACHSNSLSSNGKGAELGKLQLAPTLEDSLWAMSMVRSRTFSEEVAGEGVTLMVPYADFANHSFEPNSYFALAGPRFDLRTRTSLDAGQEACICYGEGKPNDELMRDYGFCVPCNPHDRIPVPPPFRRPEGRSLAASKPLPGLKLDSILEALSLPSGLPLDKLRGDGWNVPPFLAKPEDQQLRAALASFPLFDGSKPHNQQDVGGFSWPPRPWTSAGAAPSRVSSETEAERERQGVAVARQYYRQLLDSYPTSLEGDRTLLEVEGAQLTPRHQQAIRARMERKALLETAIRALDKYQEWLAR